MPIIDPTVISTADDRPIDVAVDVDVPIDVDVSVDMDVSMDVADAAMGNVPTTGVSTAAPCVSL